MKKVLGLGTLALAGVLAVTGCSKGMTEEEALKYAQEQGYVKADKALPAPRKAETSTGTKCTMDSAAYYGPDCSSVLLKENFWEYLGREDSAYIDLRSDKEISDSSAAGMGYIDGFQVIDYNQYIYNDSTGWFIQSTDEHNLMPRYSYSVDYLENVFPRDKNLFIMCAGGVRVTTMLKILELNGYDMSRVYNIGGSNHLKGADMATVRSNYTFKTTTEAATTWVLKYGVDNSDPSYTTHVHVLLDKAGKIAKVYVTGNVVTNSTAEWDASKWLGKYNEYTESLVGKTLADVQAMVEDGPASGTDVVTGATASSNRVLNAVIDALSE